MSSLLPEFAGKINLIYKEFVISNPDEQTSRGEGMKGKTKSKIPEIILRDGEPVAVIAGGLLEGVSTECMRFILNGRRNGI